MKRDEQIRQASIEYTIDNRPMCIGGGSFSEVVDEMNRNYAFEEGAKWADENPSIDTVKKIICYALRCTNIMLEENLENGVEWELLIKKAMKK